METLEIFEDIKQSEDIEYLTEIITACCKRINEIDNPQEQYNKKIRPRPKDEMSDKEYQDMMREVKESD